MPIYKTPTNDTYRVDNPGPSWTPPPGHVQITPDQLAQILASRIVEAEPLSAQQQIEALEREHMAPRWQREFTLGSMEREAVEVGAGQGLSPEQSIAILRTKNAGYRRLKELDEQIEVLRGQL